MKRNFRFFLFLVSTTSALFLCTQAQAIPAFARSTGLECNACHTAFPSLNDFGRAYKTHGYRLIDARNDTNKSDFTNEIRMLPVAAIVTSRPYSKETPGNTEIRAIHEAAIGIGGVFYENLSGFVEFSAEGEDGFGAVIENAAVNYDVNDNFSVQVAYAPSFFADPYDTLSEMHKVGVTHYNITDDPFGGADNNGILRHSRQQVSAFGRLFDNKLFYDVGIGGLTEDMVANQSKVNFLRLALDLAPNIMFGTFALKGECDTNMLTDSVEFNCGDGSVASTTNRKFSRAGIDTQVDFDSFRVTAVALQAKDNPMDNNSTYETNNSSYLQAVYYGKTKGNTMLVPLLRLQKSEANDGVDVMRSYVMGVNYYPQKNLKASLEYEKATTKDSNGDKPSSAVLQFQAAF